MDAVREPFSAHTRWSPVQGPANWSSIPMNRAVRDSGRQVVADRRTHTHKASHLIKILIVFAKQTKRASEDGAEDEAARERPVGWPSSANKPAVLHK